MVRPQERMGLDRGLGFHEVERFHADVVQDVGVTTHHGSPRLALRVVDRDVDGIDGRPAAPVAVEGLQRDGGRLGFEAEGSGADVRPAGQGEIGDGDVGKEKTLGLGRADDNLDPSLRP